MCFHRTLFRWLHIRDGSIMQPMSVIQKSHVLFCTKRTVPNVLFVCFIRTVTLACSKIIYLLRLRVHKENRP